MVTCTSSLFVLGVNCGLILGLGSKARYNSIKGISCLRHICCCWYLKTLFIQVTPVKGRFMSMDDSRWKKLPNGFRRKAFWWVDLTYSQREKERKKERESERGSERGSEREREREKAKGGQQIKRDKSIKMSLKTNLCSKPATQNNLFMWRPPFRSSDFS